MGWNITDSEKLEETIFKLKLSLVREIRIRRGMTVIDVGCGQGGFTSAIAKKVGENGKVIAVDVSSEYLSKFRENLKKQGVTRLVSFLQADAAHLEDIIPNEAADMVVSYRFLEELKRPREMAKVVKEMARVVKKNGKVCIIELTTEARNEAEEVYLRLHRESGDSFFESKEITEAMKTAGLANIYMTEFKTDIWFSPNLAKHNLEAAQVWYDEEVEKNLGQLINRHGMKYPALLIFSGVKN